MAPWSEGRFRSAPAKMHRGNSTVSLDRLHECDDLSVKLAVTAAIKHLHQLDEEFFGAEDRRLAA